jgi:hypothetical protein
MLILSIIYQGYTYVFLDENTTLIHGGLVSLHNTFIKEKYNFNRLKNELD